MYNTPNQETTRTVSYVQPSVVMFVVDDDDDDYDDIRMAHLPENLPVVTKQAATKGMSMAENEQVRDSAHGRTIPVRQENGTNELWYTMPYHLQQNNTSNINLALCAH